MAWARQRRRTHAPGPLEAPELTDAERRFIERMGQQVQSSGLSRIAGQIWAALVIADGPVSSSTLIATLRISKGSLSTNTRTLENFAMIERRSVTGERQDYFVLAPNPYVALIEGLTRRLEQAQAIAAEARAEITGTAARDRLAELERFYRLHRESSMALLAAMKAEG